VSGLALLPLASIDYGELLIIIGSLITSVVGASIAGVKWVGKNIDKQQAMAVTALATANDDKQVQRKDFLDALHLTTDRFTAAIYKQESECAKQRELDREQRELDRDQRDEDRRLLMRAIGLAASGDTGKFRASMPTPAKNKGPNPAQGEPS
jgi:hypothetical protein